jgi:rhodanese-related sulfurtransferase
MENMKLPHPHKIAEALPGNMRSGKPRSQPEAAGWAPLQRSYAGLPELMPAWVASHRDQLTVLDVRSAEEFAGPDGRVAGSLLIPLPELEARSGEVPSGSPVVVVCHSGSRSALATQQLLKAGTTAGGQPAWRPEPLGDGGLPPRWAWASLIPGNPQAAPILCPCPNPSFPVSPQR